VTRYLISFDDGPVTFPEEDSPAVDVAAHRVVAEARDAGVWMIPAGGGEPIVLVSGGVHTHNTWQPTPPSDGTPVASPAT
jgi:hypothetical protein